MALSFRDALAEFTKVVGLPELPDPLPSGLFDLELENGLLISVFEQQEIGAAELFCEIGSYPEFAELEILGMVAKANSGFAATAGATLGADTTKRCITMTLRVPLVEDDPERLSRDLPQFAELALDWKQAIEKKISNHNGSSEDTNKPLSDSNPLRFA